MMLCAAPLVQAEQEPEYAHPTEDPETFELNDYPAEPIQAPLEDDGTFVMPNFILAELEDDSTTYWTYYQEPLPGAEFHGPQTITVELQSVNEDGTETRTGRFDLELVDVTPPEIDVSLDSDVNPHVSFGNISRFHSPATVLPLLTVTDACDDAPTSELLLDGDAYQIGAPITSVGLHILSIVASDTSENVTSENIIFEIRERPSYTATAVVESTECDIDTSGEVATLNVTVLLGSDDFDHHDILLSSVRVIPRGADGRPLTSQPIPIKGAFIPDCNRFQHNLAEVELNECWVALTFEGTYIDQSPVQCPAMLDIIGVGVSNGEISFEWGTTAVNTADPNAAQTLADIIVVPEPCSNPEPPDPEPPVPCEAIETFVLHDVSCLVPWTPGGAGCVAGSGSRARASASTLISGNALSRANAAAASTCGPLPAACGIISGTALLIVQFEGNCCDCSVDYSGSASVTAFANVNAGPSLVGAFSGSAAAGGFIAFFCEGASVSANATASVNWSTIPPTSTPGQNPVTTMNGSGPLNCTVDGCIPSMMIVDTAVMVSTNAQSISAPAPGVQSYCTAKARVTSVVGNISASPSFQQCEPEEECDIIVVPEE